ncbi:MAG TPA: caspase family protein [Blastococcus sp.]|nr:caspase family protein [Blastococcus sp.]
MAGRRKALVVATYDYADGGLRKLAAPEHDADAFADILKDPAIAGFDVTVLVNEPHYVVGEAIADFYGGSTREDLTLLYFTGHGVKDDEGRLYLAMRNTRRDALMFTAISGAQLNDAMDASRSRRKVLILDCCYSGAFPAGRTAKSDEGVQTLERFQGKGRAVLTASDATQYAFEGDDIRGSGTSSVFTRHLVEAISSGAADLDEDGDIALDELYSYVYDRVVAEVPQQRPKKQEDVDGRILIARNVHWTLPGYIEHAVESPIAAQRLSAVRELERLHQVGNDVVRSTVVAHLGTLAADDSRSVSAAATALLERLGSAAASPPLPAAVQVPAPRVSPTPTVEPPVAAAAVPPPPVTAPHRPDPSSVVSVPPVPPPVEARSVAVEPVEPSESSEPSAVAEPAAATGPTAPASAPAAGVPRERLPGRALLRQGGPALVLALILVSAVPLTLSRLLYLETGYPDTADTFNESTGAWTGFVVLPLAAAAGLLVARSRLRWAVPVASGLVLGTALVLVEHALFWVFFFIENGSSYTAGPALWSLVLGAAVVTAAAVVVLTRSPVAGASPVRSDWRVACALVVIGSVVWFLVSGPETDFVPWWVALYEGTLLLGAAGLAGTLLWFRAEQRIAVLVGITLFGLWTIYWIVRELTESQLGYEDSVWEVELVGVVLVLLACYVAQIGPARQPSASSSTSR